MGSLPFSGHGGFVPQFLCRSEARGRLRSYFLVFNDLYLYHRGLTAAPPQAADHLLKVGAINSVYENVMSAILFGLSYYQIIPLRQASPPQRRGAQCVRFLGFCIFEIEIAIEIAFRMALNGCLEDMDPFTGQ
jgi:hypothetical protein